MHDERMLHFEEEIQKLHEEMEVRMGPVKASYARAEGPKIVAVIVSELTGPIRHRCASPRAERSGRVQDTLREAVG